MKILLENKFHYRKGGSETYYFALEDALKAAGHEVVNFAMQDDKNIPCQQSKYFVSKIEYNGPQNIISQVKSAIKFCYSKEAKQKFEQLILAEHPDVVHLNLVHHQITLSILDVCQKYNIPVVHTMHDLICACPRSTMLAPDGICEKCMGSHFLNCAKKGCIKNSKVKSLLAALEGYFYHFHKSYEKVDTYIAPSAFYKKKLEESHFTSKPIIHMKNFLPIGTKYELAKSSNKYILYLGRLAEEKGILTLIKAFREEGLPFKLNLAGTGPLMEEMQKYVRDNHLQDRVIFLGFLTENNLDKEISNAHAVVLPSEWYENGPYSIMESMAKGKPIIGSRIAGIPELVKEGKTGFCFEAYNEADLRAALERLATLTEAEYADICNNSLMFAKENFRAEKYISELIKLYQKLIDSKKKIDTDTDMLPKLWTQRPTGYKMIK